MKEIISSSPVLALPRDYGRYLVDTGASEVALAGILQQEQSWGNGKEYGPIAYCGRLSPELQKYSAPKQEMLPVASSLLGRQGIYPEGR